MKDNLSIVITIIVLVLLMVIFPLYNFFERQDDMSYNLVLKATTNFAEQVMNNGYIDQNTYDKFITELGNTGNVYDIEIEAHRKVLIGTGEIYEEQSYIDYTNDIFTEIENTSGTSNLMKRSLKNNTYLLNPKDEIYVKVKNSNTTMAGALFNVIVPTSDKTRIEINYGGIIKNNAWKDIDATYTGHNLVPGAPNITLRNATETADEEIVNQDEDYFKISKTDLVDNGYSIHAESTAFEGRSISRYFWKITDDLDSTKVKERTETTTKLQEIVSFFEEGHKYEIEVYAVDSAGYKSDSTSVKIEITSSITPTPVTNIKGDLDNDSNLTDADVSKIRDYLDNKIVFTSEEQIKADIDNNGIVNEIDYDFLNELVEKGYILGDVDLDNRISVMDSSLVDKYIKGITTLTEEQLKRADMDGNNIINNEDYELIRENL